MFFKFLPVLVLLVLLVLPVAAGRGGRVEVQHGHAVVVEVAPGKGPRAVVVGPFLLSLRVAIEALLLAVPLERFQLVFALLVTLRCDG